MTPAPRSALIAASAAALLLTATGFAVYAAGERGGVSMFGGTPARNMVSPEKGLPARFDLATGENVLWRQTLGSQAYGGPVVAGGRIFAGTNNEGLRNPKLKGDRGVVMAFDAATGEFLWQSAHEKLPSGRVNDWPLQGVCSGPMVEGDRIYYVSNRAEVIAADADGFRDGTNDGPFTGEAESSSIDEDVLWKFDMIGELDVFPHNLAAGNPLIVGDILFTVTGNGVDEGHVNIPSPLAPSFIALDKNTGKVLWENAFPGEAILHGQWSNATYIEAGGRRQIVIPGGDGWIYSFVPETGDMIWKFDANPKDSKWILGGAGTRNNVIATPVAYDGKIYVGVGQDPEHGEGPGHLHAIDASGTGDVTATHAVWHRGGEEFGRTISTVAIADGLLYAADLAGRLYCLDAATGKHHWTYDAFAAIWGSPFAADGKIYLGDEDGDLAILRQGVKLEVLGEINLGNAVYTTPVAAGGVLYVMSRNQIFAFKEGARLPPPAKPPAESSGGETALPGGGVQREGPPPIEDPAPASPPTQEAGHAHRHGHGHAHDHAAPAAASGADSQP